MQAPHVQPADAGIAASDIRAELRRVSLSPQFARRPQLQRFLNFIVEEELAGRGAQLKEYVLGVGVFGRPADFDPRLDSLVRVEARRLRSSLEEYYSREGSADPIWIELQKGSYSPSFRLPRNEAPAPSAKPTTPTGAETPLTEGRLAGRVVVIAVCTALVAVVVAVIALFSADRAPRLSERDSIVLADFSNSTGDPVFDETMKQGLTVALEQSPFLSILSDRQIGQVLKLMGRSPAAHLGNDAAQEVCARSGSKVMITGSISRLGNQYVVGLTATNCANGDAVVHLQTEAASKETVLKSLTTAAARMREKLGESLNSIQRFDVPLEEATTPSLEALQAFGMGRRTAREKGSPADIPYYKLAIELDPNFAIAHAALGVSYVNLGQPSMGMASVRRAYELRERTSEHEKFRISSYYYQVVTGELDKSIETYELWKQSYPHDFSPYINLGLAYTWVGQYEKCAEETRQALNLDADNVLSYSNLIASYIKMGKMPDAEAVLRRAQARNLNSKFLRSNAYILAFVRADNATMNRELDESKGRMGDEDALLALQSDTEAYYGKLTSARVFSRRAIESAIRTQANEAAAGWLVNAALREAEFGNPVAAKKNVAEALRLSAGRDVLVLAALASARAGDLDDAEHLARNLEKDFPTNAMIRSYWLPAIHAAIELQRRNPRRAIEALQIAMPFELGSPPPIGVATLYPVFLRAQAFRADRQFDAAAQEAQKIIERPYLVLNYPLGPLAHVELGRARAMLHKQAGAREAYDAFFRLWKDGDPDVPVFGQARAEYSRLQ